MPRPQKDGLDYFPLDVTFFTDPKIKILKARYGVDGIAVYVYLLCEIYRVGYYIQLNEDSIYIFSDDLKMSAEKVMQVLNFLLERSLFSSKLFQSDKVLTSAGIQKRFQLAVKERAKKNPINAAGFWLLPPEKTEPFIKVHPHDSNSGKKDDNSGKNSIISQEKSLKESKEKESKGNKSKYISPEVQDTPGKTIYELTLIDGNRYPVKEGEIQKYRLLYPAIDVDQEFRKMIGWLDSHPKNRKTSRGIGKFINGWLCRAQDSARPKTSEQDKPKNRFNNFEQRENNYESMVWSDIKKRKANGEGGDHGRNRT